MFMMSRTIQIQLITLGRYDRSEEDIATHTYINFKFKLALYSSTSVITATF